MTGCENGEDSESPESRSLLESDSLEMESLTPAMYYSFIVFFHCTLSSVLHGFGRCIVVASRATSSESCHHATLFACTPLCTFYQKNLEFFSVHA